MKLKRNWITMLYVLPAALFITVFCYYPAVYTVFLSFTEWNLLSSPKWVGFHNYITIFTDPGYLVSLKNTLIWVVVSLTIPIALGLLMASGLRSIFGQILYKNVFYLPYAISGTVVGVIWVFLYSDSGINYLLREVGLQHWAKDWLNTPPYNTIAMLIAHIWQVAGTNMMLFLVGMGAIPKDVYEAAALDGASRNQSFWNITLPLLQPMTIVVVGVSLVSSFKAFDTIWIMTQGGPYGSSETFAVSMFRESFMLFNMGQGAAIAMVLTIATLGASWFYLKRTIGTGEN